MFSPENPHMKNMRPEIDFTQANIRQRISPEIWDQVVESAKIIQEENDLPFEKGDVVFHPDSESLYEVMNVLDNRHRMAIRQIYLECRKGKNIAMLAAPSVLHASYLILAHMLYDSKTSIIQGESMEEILKNLGGALDNLHLSPTPVDPDK